MSQNVSALPQSYPSNSVLNLDVVTTSFQGITLKENNAIFSLLSLIYLYPPVIFPLPANIPSNPCKT